MCTVDVFLHTMYWADIDKGSYVDAMVIDNVNTLLEGEQDRTKAKTQYCNIRQRWVTFKKAALAHSCKLNFIDFIQNN